MAEVKLTITDRAGQVRELRAQTGAILMEVLREHVDLTLDTCGGAISCGTCLVRLGDPWFAGAGAPGEDEAEMLEALGAEGTCRLSCQVTLDAAADGQQLVIAPAS